MRLLLVEDKQRMAQALCEILRQEGYDTDHFAGGREGLYALETGAYNLAVLDANMELLSREMGDNVWLSNIRYENQRMSGLISQLLELAKTENVAPPKELLNFSRLVLGEDAVANTVTLTGEGQWEEGA